MKGIKGMAETFVCIMAMLFTGISRAQVSTNPPLSGNEPLTNQAAANTNDATIIPLVTMRDVPIGTAIENLARQAGINYIIDRRVAQGWIDSKEPTVSFRLEHVTAKDVLQRMLNLHNLALVENQPTGVARITSSNQTASIENDVLLTALLENTPAGVTNNVFPLVQFEEVPLDIALEHLTRQSRFHFDYASRLENSGGEPWFPTMPSVSVRWENISATQATFALCDNYDLTVSKDDATGVLTIEPKKSKTHHP